jgi:hypothetical protein
MCNSISSAIAGAVFSIVAAIAAQSALAQPGLTFSSVRVDVSPLRANAGDPTADSGPYLAASRARRYNPLRVQTRQAMRPTTNG